MRIAPAVAEVLRKSTFDAFNGVIDLCIREQVDALLVAGDIFDSGDRSLVAQLRFVDGLRRLETEGIRSFVCHGNHDPLDSWHAQVAFPANCCRFGSTVTSTELCPGDADSPLVYGYSYQTREVRENLVPYFESEFRPGRISLGLLHANVGADTGHESYAPCNVEDLARVGIHYWALGHVHTRQEHELPEGLAVYPGNTQGRHPNETGARGVYLVSLTDGGHFATSFRPVDLVRWEQIEVDISNFEDQHTLERAVERVIDLALEKADGRHLVYRTLVTGRGPLHSLVHKQEYTTDLASRLNEAWAERNPFAYCDRVTAATRPMVDRQARVQADDFVGDLLRLFDNARDDDTITDKLLDELRELYEHPRARKYLAYFLPNDVELAQLLADAETVCLDNLASEDRDEN